MIDRGQAGLVDQPELEKDESRRPAHVLARVIQATLKNGLDPLEVELVEPHHRLAANLPSRISTCQFDEGVDGACVFAPSSDEAIDGFMAHTPVFVSDSLEELIRRVERLGLPVRC
jgi:hypothetical protein